MSKKMEAIKAKFEKTAEMAEIVKIGVEKIIGEINASGNFKGIKNEVEGLRKVIVNACNRRIEWDE